MPIFKKNADNNSVPIQYLDFLTFQMEKYCRVRERFFSKIIHMTPAEFRCLRTISVFAGISTKQLARELELSPGRITHLLTSLERMGLIIREIDEKDRRSVNVSLTEDAGVYLDAIMVEFANLHKSMTKLVPADKRDESFCVLKLLFDSIHKWALSK